MNWSDAVEILKNFRNRLELMVGGVMPDRYFWGTVIRVVRSFTSSSLQLGPVLCEQQPISRIWLGASRLSRSELGRLSRRHSYSEVQIADGIR